MIPIVSLPTYQSTITNPGVGAAFSTAQSDTAIGRLPVQSVAATIAITESQNQSRGNGQGKGQAPANTVQQGLSNPLAILNTSAAPAVSNSTSSLSSLFLAQLFGQSATQDSGLLGSYLGSFSPSATLGYETMIAYSRVKYKPSNASLPQPESPAEKFVKIEQPSTSQVREMIARALQNQVVQQEPMNTATVASQPATTSQGNFAAVLSSVPVVKNASLKPASGNPPSLIRSSIGTGSYEATVSRNTLNLAQDVKPQYQLSL